MLDFKNKIQEKASTWSQNTGAEIFYLSHSLTYLQTKPQAPLFKESFQD